EDRVVKQEFRALERSGLMDTLTRKPLRPSAAEVRSNARSRSAKLRASERLEHPVMLQGGPSSSWR
ncbi:MAG TPA: 16S rRNA (cytosine(1402)-N(4))-methyltransferase, partial [Candidatus Eremiobacteraceae bacterium]|nr:16S rRNA (cytosine(1402)-N(4))-methyltransferase [Candidatus Eremiobacteraceae bacterium]